MALPLVLVSSITYYSKYRQNKKSLHTKGFINHWKGSAMSVAEALALMIGFGSFLVSLIGLVVKIAKAVQQDKE